MTAQQLLLHQYPGQVRRVGEIVFIDFGSLIESRVVVMTVQRYEERKTA